MENKTFIKEFLTSLLETGETEVAFSLYDGVKVSDITYTRFLKDILHCAGYLSGQGFRGKHVALAAPNSYEWVVFFFGILASGNVAVPLNYALPANALAKQMEQADATVVCCSDEGTEALRAAAPQMQYISICERIPPDEFGLEDVCCAGSDETILMLATSGTTGESKLTEFTDGGLREAVFLSSREFSAGFSGLDIEKFYLCLPLFHTGGLMAVLAVIHLRLILCMGRGISHIFDDIAVFNPDITAMVPAVMEVTVKLLKRTSTPEQRAKILGTRMKMISTGSASISAENCVYLMNLGLRLSVFYGMTESGGVGTSCVLDESHIGTIGKPYGKISCRVEDNELMLSGPSLMKGYYKDPAGTAAVITNGWLKTGDLVRYDDDGYFYITGRKKNVIILSNGENVNPEEIEKILNTSDDILECMVYSDKKGILADIYTENKKSAAAFIKKYNEQVPMYRQIYKVNYFSMPLEKTGIGKIKRKENEYAQ